MSVFDLYILYISEVSENTFFSYYFFASAQIKEYNRFKFSLRAISTLEFKATVGISYVSKETVIYNIRT